MAETEVSVSEDTTETEVEVKPEVKVPKKECTPKDKKFPWNKQEYECPIKPTNKT